MSINLDQFGGQSLTEQTANLKNVKAPKRFLKKSTAKKNFLRDSSLKTASDMTGVEDIGLEANQLRQAGKAPSLTQTRQETEGTPEQFMAAWDVAHPIYGKPTNGFGEAGHDPLRKAVLDRVKGLIDPDTGQIPVGYATALKGLLRKAKDSGVPLSPQDIDDSLSGDLGGDIATGIAETAKGTVTLPSEFGKAALSGPASEAFGEDHPATKFAEGIGGAAPYFTPVGGALAAMGTATGIAEGGVEGGVKGAAEGVVKSVVPIDQIKVLFDPGTDIGTRSAAAVNVALMALGGVHMLRTGGKMLGGNAVSDYAKSIREITPEQLSQHLGLTPEQSYKVAETIKATPPEEIQAHIDRSEFTKKLLEQETPMVTEPGPKFTAKGKSLGKEAVPENPVKVEQPGVAENPVEQPVVAQKPVPQKQIRTLTVGGTDFDTGGAKTESIVSEPVDIGAPQGLNFYIGRRSVDGAWVVSDGNMAPVGFGKTQSEAIGKARKFFDRGSETPTPLKLVPDDKVIATSPDGRLQSEVSYRGPGKSQNSSVVFDPKSGMQFEVQNDRLFKPTTQPPAQEATTPTSAPTSPEPPVNPAPGEPLPSETNLSNAQKARQELSSMLDEFHQKLKDGHYAPGSLGSGLGSLEPSAKMAADLGKIALKAAEAGVKTAAEFAASFPAHLQEQAARAWESAHTKDLTPTATKAETSTEGAVSPEVLPQGTQTGTPKGKSESEAGLQQSQENSVPPLNDTPTSPPKKTFLKNPAEPKTTGINNRAQEKHVLDGVIEAIPSAKGKSAEEWTRLGKEAVDNGTDYLETARRVGDGGDMSALDVGVLKEGNRRLLQDVNNAKRALDAKPGDKQLKADLDNAQAKLQNYLLNIRAGKGRASDVFRSFQGEVDIDTGDFAQVISEARSKKHNNAKHEAELERLSGEVAKRDAEIERLKANPREFDAKQAVSQARTRKYDRASLKTNIESNRAKLKTLVGSPGPSSKRAGSVSITVEDFKVAGERILVVKDIALDYARLHVGAGLEDIVIGVQKMLKDDGIDIERQAVIDALAHTEKGKPKSASQKSVDDIRAEAKKVSSDALDKRAKKEAQAVIDKAAKMEKAEADALYKKWWAQEAAILDAKEQLSTGLFRRKVPKERTVTDEIADLEAQRKIWDSRVRAKLNELDTSRGKRFLKGGLNTVRGTVLGSDFGVLTRQGLFSFSRPKAFLKGLSNAKKTMFSEENLAKWATAQEEKRYSDGKLALRVRRDAGLSLTDSLNSHEEMVLPKFVKKVFGDKVGGFLERGQTTFINTVRAEIFDAAYEKGLTPEELQSRARYINNVTGRGNVKQVPDSLSMVMTSPRYEASRWGTLREFTRNFNPKDKGQMQNLQDLAVTTVGLFALYKTAELAGYKTSIDPKDSDFLKLRNGNEVWDVTAGLAPRARDVLGLVATAAHLMQTGKIDIGKDVVSVGGKALGRTINPAVRTVIDEVVIAAQRHNHVSDPKRLFTGFSNKEDAEGLAAFLPLILQSMYQAAQNHESPAQIAGVGAKEFIGGGVNFYNKNKPKPSSSHTSHGSHSSHGGH